MYGSPAISGSDLFQKSEQFPDIGREVLVPSIPNWLYTKSDVPPQTLNWRPEQGSSLASEPGEEDSSLRRSQAWFSSALKRAEVCDLQTIPVPGATILLPWGVQLVERLAAIIRDQANSIGFHEFQYPQLAPLEWYEPIADLINLDTSILRIRSTTDKPELSKFGLTPTGEPIIYSHWRRLLRDRSKYPLRMFQRATYWRPFTSHDRSGGGVFLSLEARDVFEFHGCYLDALSAINELQILTVMLARIGESAAIGSLWTLRPPWTNRGQFYNWGLAGDCPLPSGHTVQVASTYFQGDKLSRRFNVGVHRGGSLTYSQQIDGVLSRRLLFAHLFQTAGRDGSLNIHPVMSPLELVVLVQSDLVNLVKYERLVRDLRAQGRRVDLEVHASKREITRSHKKWCRRGLPLIAFILDEDSSVSAERITLWRLDTRSRLECQKLQALPALVSAALSDIKAHAEARTWKYLRSKVGLTDSAEDADAITTRGGMALMPLLPRFSAVRQLQSSLHGEVLGFALANEKTLCPITGENTAARAFVSRRY